MLSRKIDTSNAEFPDEMNRRFDGVDRRINGLENRLRGVEVQVATLVCPGSKVPVGATGQ